MFTQMLVMGGIPVRNVRVRDEVRIALMHMVVAVVVVVVQVMLFIDVIPMMSMITSDTSVARTRERN